MRVVEATQREKTSMNGWIGPRNGVNDGKPKRQRKKRKANPPIETKAPRFRVGDDVMAPFEGDMYACTVLKFKGGKAKVKWLEYDEESWVPIKSITKEKLKPKAKPKPKAPQDWHKGTLLGLVEKTELDDALRFLRRVDWTEYNTPTSKRKVAEWSFQDLTEEEKMYGLPHKFAKIQPILGELLFYLQQSAPDETIVPIQCFMCLYEGAEDSCPNHRHRCRQITLSLGSPRTFVIDREYKVKMKHGDIIILNRQPHSVPKGGANAMRISINIFYAYQSDFEKDIVSVNS